jgi:coiled-coil domain-containing protein 6
MQTDSELESDTSSINDGVPGGIATISQMPASKETLDKRIESLVQENRVLKMEIETFKLRVKSMQEENFMLRKASVNIQVKKLAAAFII